MCCSLNQQTTCIFYLFPSGLCMCHDSQDVFRRILQNRKPAHHSTFCTNCPLHLLVALNTGLLFTILSRLPVRREQTANSQDIDCLTVAEILLLTDIMFSSFQPFNFGAGFRSLCLLYRLQIGNANSFPGFMQRST